MAKSTGVLRAVFAAALCGLGLIGPIAPASAQPAPAAGIQPPAPLPEAPPAAALRTPARERPAPGQDQIARVVTEGRDGMEACYQRALTRDPGLVQARLTVRLSIAASGQVRTVKISGPAEVRPLERCLRRTIARWMFPAAPEAYAAEVPLVLEGVR